MAEAVTDPNLELWPIGNCQVSGLIDQSASLVWGCVPRVDGDPVFCALLNGEKRDSGVWRFELENQTSVTQHYERNTAILVTRLESEDGSAVEIRDFCPRYERSGRMYRPVAFARIVRPVSGVPRLKVTLNPMRDYGATIAEKTNGTNHIRYLVGPQAMRLSTDAPVGYVLESRYYRVEADQHFFLGPDEPFVGNVRSELRRMEQSTARYWKLWVRGLHIPLEWQDEVIRCAITLKLCQHEETGAIVAALTTSIPEAAHSERNWDYRFCWIRDSYYTVQALNRLGALDVLEKYLGYLRNIVDSARGGQIQPLYSVMGEGELDETTAAHLAGYRGMGPVRKGNAAYKQIQHDCYGQIVLPTAQAFFDRRLLRMADDNDFESLEEVGEMAWKMHDQPDAGLWEFRTRQEVHTYSAVMSWAACDRLAKVAANIDKADRQQVWQERADAIRAKIEDKAWVENGQEGGHYGASFESDYLDASLLQMVELRFLQPDNPRFQSTFTAIEKTLRRGEHMLRYASEDDFGLPETAFNVCTFWLIEALHLAGRDEEARTLFTAMLSHTTESGLLSEDLDFETGELWGNFPQTYSLVGVINCAGLLSRPWSEMR
ncbi:glycoside hydrolase family 15 protein [Pontixanthobacter aestiaquae]|uniref:Glycoside hydrolase family 15 protein n=1 Tax=Pontixanthobacter aestiaquae TaxID=1509367 RepID=A0A844ZBW7_9SPHN|nr:glycoside hydrolase family 15 protein [Pontixanthobacter aestiaquae]MDN3645673.1 glycoside hydrolase family 15 protein [Pontixanthobacter aestiaquae]MXO83329.1 glycoside hydrolase family 15 protein [Pontixanthobacter aestiaquae]